MHPYRPIDTCCVPPLAAARSRRLLSVAFVLCAAFLLSLDAPTLLGQAEVRNPPPLVPPSVKRARGVGSTRAPGGLAATVGDEVITQAQLTKRVERRRAQLSSLYPSGVIERELVRLEWYTLDQFINDKLLLQEVRKEEQKLNEGKPFVTDFEIDAYVKREIEFLREKHPGIKDEEDVYRLYREAEGMTRGEYREFVKDQISIGMFLQQKVYKRVEASVSPQEAKVYYQSHLDEFTVPEKISFRQIVIKVNRDNNYMARRDAVEKGLKEGTDFVELAKTFSEEVFEGNPETAGRLWEKTFEELKSWREPIPETLRRMKKGEVSSMVLTATDIRFLRVENVVEGKPKPFSEAQETIGEKIRQVRKRAEFDAFLKQLRDKVKPEIFIAPPPEEPAPNETTDRGKKPAEDRKEKETEKKEQPAPADPGP